jgi:uncharacterized protein
MPRAGRFAVPVELDAFLTSDRAPAGSMSLSCLDGFLTAIALGPERIPLREWLPAIWRGETPVFDDADEAWSVLSLVVIRYKGIVSSLQSAPEVWAPVYAHGPAGEVGVSDWAAGFLEGVDMRPGAWSPLFEDREAAVLMLPILLATGERGVAKAMGIGPAEEGEWLIRADRRIPLAVMAIDAFWKQRRQAGPSP